MAFKKQDIETERRIENLADYPKAIDSVSKVTVPDSNPIAEKVVVKEDIVVKEKIEIIIDIKEVDP